MKKSYTIVGMHCASCARLIEKSILKVPGVKDVNVNYGNEQAFVEALDKVDYKKIKEAVEKAGYKLGENLEGEKKKSLNLLRKKVILSSVFSVVIMVLAFLPNVSGGLYIQLILASIIQFYLGLGFYQATISGIKNRAMSMDTLIAIGTTAAYGYSLFSLMFGGEEFYFDTSSMIITLILLGRFLEAKAKSKTSDSIKKLVGLTPKKALLIKGKKEVEVAVENLTIGDLVKVRPGEKIVTDGVVIEGETYIDESLVTGESVPVGKSKGDKVIGGTINTSGSIIFKVTKVGKDTFLAQIIKLVSDAQGSRAEIQRLADKVSSYFVPIVLVIAIVTFVIWSVSGSFNGALVSSVAVLIIACPCAMGLATPTAIMVGVGKGAENGILVKDVASLETLYKVKTMIFDKTGTLTKGKMTLLGKPDRKFLAIAASLEQNSEHPIAKAFINKAKEEGVAIKKVKSFRAIEGMGVEGVIGNKKYFLGRTSSGGEISLVSNKKVLATYEVSDELKEGVKDVLQKVENRGIDVWMLTGDKKVAAEKVARKVGIKNVLSGILPGEKAKKVGKFSDVAFVGDGVNDAPALAAADVGIAMGTGTDVAIETSGITLLNKKFSAVTSAINLSNATIKTIRTNLLWAFLYNIILIPVAAVGLLDPMIAAAAMALSSISVIGNSLRLRLVKI